MAPMSLESATPVKITNKATTIVTKKATPVMVQKIVEKPPPVGKILERESFDDKDVSTGMREFEQSFQILSKSIAFLS